MDSYSLLEFNKQVKAVLDKNLEKSYWIVAEIGELNVNQKGHCYLNLIEKENNQIVANTRATIWSYTYASLANWFANMTGSQLKAGLKIMVNASVQYHEVYGFSLNIKDIDPNFTIGERERKKQETIKKLEAEGIIEMNRTVSLPLVPQRIAIISSETAAGYGDFMHQLDSNPYGYAIDHTLFQATMQGDQAVESILQALHRIYELEENFDLIVLIRGGGAQTDLDCFDDYDLCAHLAQFPLPIVTGIGHERDSTIADLVANTRMKTPTAVAEFILGGFIDFENQLLDLYEKIESKSKEILSQNSERIHNLVYAYSLAAQNTIHSAQSQLAKVEDSVSTLPNRIIEKQHNRLEVFEKTITANDPQKILDRGFTYTTVNEKPVLAVSKIKSGDKVVTFHKKGTFESRVN